MDPGIAAIFGALIGGTVGCFGSYFVATNTLKRQSFNTAASKFSRAFIDEIRKLDQRYHAINTDDFSLYEFLRANLPKHERAMLMFKPYLSQSERFYLDKAWKEYCNPEGIDMAGYPFMSYFEEGNKYDVTYALSKIYALLEYAKPK